MYILSDEALCEYHTQLFDSPGLWVGLTLYSDGTHLVRVEASPCYSCDEYYSKPDCPITIVSSRGYLRSDVEDFDQDFQLREFLTSDQVYDLQNNVDELNAPEEPQTE